MINGFILLVAVLKDFLEVNYMRIIVRPQIAHIQSSLNCSIANLRGYSLPFRYSLGHFGRAGSSLALSSFNKILKILTLKRASCRQTLLKRSRVKLLSISGSLKHSSQLLTVLTLALNK